MSTELLMALACTLPCIAVAAVALGVFFGLDAARRNTRRVAEQEAVLQAIGLTRVVGTPWYEGTVAARPVAVKAQRAARVHGGHQSGGVQLNVRLVALFPVDVPVPEHIHPNNPGPSATRFERHFYVAGGRPPAGIPDPLRRALLAWALEATGDAVEVAPRDSRHLYAGQRFTDARTLVRVASHARMEPASLQRWLLACVDRVMAMEAVA